MAFAVRLKHARKASGKTQRAIADAMGVSVQAVSQWEKGQVTIQTNRIARLAEILEVNSQWLAEGQTASPVAEKNAEIHKTRNNSKNRIVGVVYLRDIYRAFITFDRNQPDSDINNVSDAEEYIYVDENIFIDPLPIRIEDNTLAPELLEGDIAIFDNGVKAVEGDIVVMMMSLSGIFQISQIRERVASLRPAIARFPLTGDEFPNRVLVDVKNLVFDQTQKPAFMILGPLIERRTFRKNQATLLDKNIK